MRVHTVAVAAVIVLVVGSDAHLDTCVPKNEDDAASLLQKQQQHSRSGPLRTAPRLRPTPQHRSTLAQRTAVPPPATRNALAIQGGGWLAQFASFGLLVGLARSAGSAADSEGSGKIPALLEGFDIISATSGGSWLTNSMVFSASWMEWMERLVSVADTGAIPGLYNEWIDNLNKGLPKCNDIQVTKYATELLTKWLAFGYLLPSSSMSFLRQHTNLTALQGAVSPKSDPAFERLFDVVQGGPVLEVLKQTCQVFRGDWRTTVQKMLAATAGVAENATLAKHPYNAWAKGKTLISTISMPMRTDANTDWMPQADKNVVKYNGPARPNVLYVPNGNHPQNMPAKISWVVGESGDVAALDFCPGCSGISYSYIGGKTTKPFIPMEAMWDQQYTQSAGNLEISLVSAASSAFDGRANVARSRKQGYIPVLGEAAVWAAVAEGESVLAGGGVRNELPGKRLAVETEMAARTHLHALTDGGDTDLTGMIQAVAAGAESVVSLQIAHADGGRPDTLDMFSSDGHWGVGSVFNTSEADIEREFNKTSNWINCTDGACDSGLLRLVYFSKMLHTVPNPHFGIHGVRPVNVSFIWVVTNNSVIDIGPPYNTFEQYGPMVKDIADLLHDHPDDAKRLQKIFASR